jgi:hypothetical protein
VCTSIITTRAVSPWGADGGDDDADEEPSSTRGAGKGGPVAPWLKGPSTKAATGGAEGDVVAARKAITSANIELRHPQAGRRKRDEWEEAYDRGKVKKVKNQTPA